MDSIQPLSDSAFRGRLDVAGYLLTFRVIVWTECLVERSNERWVGRGDNEEDALGDVLRQMFPSQLAQALLDAEMRTLEDAARVSATATTEGPIAAPAVEVVRVEATAVREAARSVEPAASDPPRIAVEDALAQLDGLQREIEERLPEFALTCADRQRIQLVAWICRARAANEAWLDVREIDVRVARIARRLGEIARTFWPGRVAALQLSAEPHQDQELRTAGPMPKTWASASERAQQLLAARRARDRAAGLDEHGWADAGSLAPRPVDRDAMLAEVTREIERCLGGLPIEAREPAKREADVRALVVAARALRWLRGATTEPTAWGAAVGMLRRTAQSLGSHGATLRNVLDARTRPSAPWRDVVAGPPETAPPEAAEERAAVMADLPARGASPEELVAWAVRAFDAMATPDVAAALAELGVDVGAFEKAAEAQEDRRLRRRLRELVRRLRPVEADEDAPPSAAEDDGAAEPPPSMPFEQRESDALAARVRERIQGQRALFVSNREDPELEARLTEALGVEITWCSGSQRKVQAQEVRIAKGGYDLVMLASGFQSHSVDVALAKAAQSAGVPYVRVNRGRTAACVQAIARELGLLGAASDREGSIIRSNA